MGFPFSDHVALLDVFLDRRKDVVERIEKTLLNVRGKDLQYSRERGRFDRLLDGAFFSLPGLSESFVRLHGRLAEAHVAAGYVPVALDGFSQALDPLELIVRAYHYWGESRWPGGSGRLAYANDLFAVFMIRQLEHLSMRIGDGGQEEATPRLAEVQRLLDRLNVPPARAIVRDARWLIQTAQGPLTPHLRPYFETADRLEASLSAADRLALHKAGAKLAGGHLRSQLRYRVWNAKRPIDDPEILAFMRNSNSMDGALLVRDLVPVLEAYAIAVERRDEDARLDLADSILQGLSADPELYLVRLDLLPSYTMLEDLFLERTADGTTGYSAMGRVHLDALARFRQLIGRLAESLRADAAAFDPAGKAYSPFGIAYGFCSDIMSNMAATTLVSQTSTGLSFEDTFDSRGDRDARAARARQWQTLPKRAGERDHFEHSLDWAAQVFARLTAALDARVRAHDAPNGSSLPSRRLFVLSESDTAASPADGELPSDVVLADEHCFTSDMPRALAGVLIGISHDEMLVDRHEGRFLASAESDGHWFGISKVILTLCLGQGKDALLTAIPQAVLDVLPLTCPGLVISPYDGEPAAGGPRRTTPISKTF